jgi:hypothetical protein
VKISSEITRVLSIVSIILIVIQGFIIARFEINRLVLNRENTGQFSEIPEDLDFEKLPDIYFIIFDAYTSTSVLKERFNYDNSEVIAELEELGFYSAYCSQSNYTRTEYTITSTLNMEYLDTILDNPTQLPDYEYSYTLQFLENYGYQKIKFETKADHNLSFGEDIYLARERDIGNMFNVFPFNKMTEYESELIETTWLQPVLQLILNLNEYLPSEWVLDVKTAKYYENYNQVFYMLEELTRVPQMEVDGPKFVYAHFLAPHEPYIFHPSGRYEFHKRSEEYRLGYANNVKFIDSKLPDLLGKIIDRSETPPIIIVMGDHGSNGPDPFEMLPILNMYYLPNGGDGELYPSISPVNTFRVILNHYFNTDFEILEDISYFGNEFDMLKEYDNFCDVEDQ